MNKLLIGVLFLIFTLACDKYEEKDNEKYDIYFEEIQNNRYGLYRGIDYKYKKILYFNGSGGCLFVTDLKEEINE